MACNEINRPTSHYCLTQVHAFVKMVNCISNCNIFLGTYTNNDNQWEARLPHGSHNSANGKLQPDSGSLDLHHTKEISIQTTKEILTEMFLLGTISTGCVQKVRA